MKIKKTNVHFSKRKNVINFLMRTLLLLFCSTVLAFSPVDVFSQRTKVIIEADKVISVEEVFNIIKQQTDYNFVYRADMFADYPKVNLKKGAIKANKLLELTLPNQAFKVSVVDESTIVIENKPKVQQRISGTVTDTDNVPLAGATVIIKGTTTGTSTDFDGNYSISANTGETLVYSYLGKENFEVVVNDDTAINVTLESSSESLDEVIIVGYGTTRKSDLTGSVGSVKSEDIQQIKAQTIDETLIGQIPGVLVSAQSGGPGSGAIVNIRGLSQLIGDNQPLYVVDGVPIIINPQFNDTGIGVFGDRENPLLSINPADIERVDVLKDASSAAIYGSRAANGVILITTKRGKRNRKPKFDFSYSTTVQNPLNTYDVLSASQFQQFITDQGLDAGVTFGDSNTDWQKEIINSSALWNQYDFNVSGGSEKVNYLVSARVSDQEGLMLGNDFKRYNFSSSLDADITDRLNFGFNFSYNYSINEQSGLTSLSSGAFFRPDLPVFNDDGTFTTVPGRFGLILRNPVGDQGQIKDKAISQNILGSAYGEYKILDGLKLRSQLSVNVNNDRSSTFSPSFTLNAQFGQFFGTQGALLDVQHTAGTNTSFSNTLNYNKTFLQKHTIDAVFGLSWDQSRLDLESQEYAGFPDDEVLTNINSANDFVGAGSDAYETALNSLFGRINYNFDNRYLATFTARSDGSIKFGPDNQRGFFPSGALAWNVHNEQFLKESDVLNLLKLRASFGQTGLDNLPTFTYLANYQSLSNGDSFYDGINGISINGVPNSAIRWEKTNQLDLGLEFGLFKNRLFGEIVYFEKKTSDIILIAPIPAQTGFSNWNANIADVTNKGWEFAFGGDIIRNTNFRWNSTFNISFVQNNVDALNGGITSAFGNTGIIEGEPIGVVSGYDVVSIAQTQEEIDALNATAPDGNYFTGLREPGDYIYRDVDGDGEITNEDVTPLGDINPDYFGGWNNTISYKGFDFNFNFNYVQGNAKQWSRGTSQFSFVDPNTNVTTDIFDAWTPDNTDAKYARIGSATHSTRPAISKNIEDGSYIKLRSASLGYNIPRAYLDKYGIDNFRITLSGNNLFVITNYPGIDPESVGTQRGGSTVDLIRDRGSSYPQARLITLGFNVSL